MIIVKRVGVESLEEVYQWYQKAEGINRKNYEDDRLNIFFRRDLEWNQEMLKRALEDVENTYFYLAYIEKEIVGILYGYTMSLRNHNLNIPLIYALNKDIYQSLLKELWNTFQDKNGIVKIRPVFPKEKELIDVLKENDFILRRTSYTLDDLMVEKKNKQINYKISFLNKREVKEVQAYYDTLQEKEKEFRTLQIEDYQKENASRILIAKNKKKVVGLLLGTISNHRYIVSYIDVCVADREGIRHDLLNEFKRICLKEESDDILVETTNQSLQDFLKREKFIESRSTYYRKIQK